MVTGNSRFEKLSTRLPLPISDISQATEIVNHSYTATLTAGSAGELGYLQLPFGPVAAALGDRIGTSYDTSLVFTGTAFGTEVSFTELNNRSAVTYVDQDAAETSVSLYNELDDGEYVVIYETGKVIYMRDSNAGTIAVTYKYRRSVSGVGVTFEGDIEVGAVEIKDGVTDTRAVVGANGLYVDVQASALPAGAATEATLSSIDGKIVACDTTNLATEATVGDVKTAVELIDDAIYTNSTGTPSKGLLIMGSDGTNPQALKVNSDGELAVNLETADIEIGAVEIKNSTDDTRATVGANGLYVDVQASALPTGAATEATVATLATEATLSALNGKVTACDTGSVTVASSALPTGAATEATVATLATEATLSSLNGKVTACDTGSVTVASSALPTGAATEATVATLATEATLSALNGKVTACDTGSVTVASSALPTGAATEATLSTIDADTSSLAGCVAGTEVQVDVVSSALPTGAATEATLSTLNGKVTACDTGSVTVASSALPTGAATESTLATIDADTSALAGCVAGTEVQVDVASIAAGDNNIGNVDIVSLPAGNIGQQAMAASLSVVPANNITDATYIGDIKFGEALPAGTASIGTVGESTTPIWSVDQSAALEASSVAKASAGVIREFDGRIDSTAPSATYYIQFLDAASLPADGAVTMLRTPVKVIHTTGADSLVAVDFLANGLTASSGIVWCISSTEFIKTVGGNYVSATVRFV